MVIIAKGYKKFVQALIVKLSKQGISVISQLPECYKFYTSSNYVNVSFKIETYIRTDFLEDEGLRDLSIQVIDDSLNSPLVYFKPKGKLQFFVKKKTVKSNRVNSKQVIRESNLSKSYSSYDNDELTSSEELEHWEARIRRTINA